MTIIRTTRPAVLLVLSTACFAACSGQRMDSAPASAAGDTLRADFPSPPTDDPAGGSAGDVLLPGGVLEGVAARTTGLLAVGWDSAGPAVFLSADGERWSRTAFPAGTGVKALHAVAAGPEGWLAVGADARGNSSVWASADGTSWRVAPAAGLTGGRVNDLAYGPTGYVAVGDLRDPGESDNSYQGVVWTSPDGRDWRRIPDPAGVFRYSEGTLSGVAAAGPGWVAVGLDINGGIVWTSSGGGAWSRLRTEPAVFEAAALHGAGGEAGALLLVGATIPDNQPLTWTYGDGRGWTRRALRADALGTGAVLNDVTRMGDSWFAAGRLAGGGVVWTSTDGGDTWRLVQAGRR